jgi:hypothetical protein
MRTLEAGGIFQPVAQQTIHGDVREPDQGYGDGCGASPQQAISGQERGLDFKLMQLVCQGLFRIFSGIRAGSTFRRWSVEGLIPFLGHEGVEGD